MSITAFVPIAAAAGIFVLSVAGAMVVIDRIPGDQVSAQAASAKSDFNAEQKAEKTASWTQS
jgi:hypothetical protein